MRAKYDMDGFQVPNPINRFAVAAMRSSRHAEMAQPTRLGAFACWTRFAGDNSIVLCATNARTARRRVFTNQEGAKTTSNPL